MITATPTVTNLDRARVALVTSHPFFASILLKRKLIVDDTVPTAAVDQRGQIYLNPGFAAQLSVDQLVFLLAHEVGHVIGQHAARRGSRNAKRWNIAGDAWINDMLKDAGVGEFIEGGVDMPGSKDLTVDKIFASMPDQPYGSGRSPGGDSDDGHNDPGPGGIGEDLIERGAPLSPEEAEQIDSDTRIEIAQAALAAKAQGKLPGALSRIIAKVLDVTTPWYEILEQHMVSFTRGDYSWSRPNRRFRDAYLPSVGKVAQMGELVIQVDVSGSVSPQELNYYNGHLQRIIELCVPERVHVLYTDTGVCKHDQFERGEEFALQFYSGGGTDMEEGFRYLDKQGIEPEVFVCLTDGYTTFRTDNAPSYPVVWCISTDVTAPYGTTVPFTME